MVNLTLTNVVFEFKFLVIFNNLPADLTLTNVVFEYLCLNTFC